MLTQLQAFYDKMSKVAREKVILTYNHPIFHKDHYRSFMGILSKGGKFGEFRESKQVNTQIKFVK
jgi:hypothetical protein